MSGIEPSATVVLFVSSSDPGGAESMVVDLASRLARRGVRVEIWHFGNPWLQQSAERHGLTSVVLRDRYFRKSYWLLHFSFYLARQLRRRRIAVLHSHLYPAIVGAALAARLAGVVHVGTLHDRYSLFEKPGRIGLLRLVELLGTHLVAVSAGIQADLVRHTRAAWRRLSTVHNGIELPAHRVVAAPAAPAGAAITFICVARLVPLKRLDLLIRAVAELPPELQVRLWIAGDGPERASLEQLIAEVDARHRVELLGFRNDVAALLRGADCFTLVSDTEGLSFSILESMAAGIPAVVTNVGGNAELVTNGVSGIVIPPGDLVALKSALTKVVEDVTWRRAAGEQARQRAHRHFSADAMTDSYVALYGAAIRPR